MINKQQSKFKLKKIPPQKFTAALQHKQRTHYHQILIVAESWLVHESMWHCVFPAEPNPLQMD